MLDNIENYKNELLAHIEELLLKNIDKTELISKKVFQNDKGVRQISEKERLNLR